MLADNEMDLQQARLLTWWACDSIDRGEKGRHESSMAKTAVSEALYRVADRDEWSELGVDEILEGEGIALLEWADRFREQMPSSWLEIAIEVHGEHERSFTCTAHGKRYEELIALLQS